MVSFICDACGQTVKKNRVEKHYQTECRNCSVLSCIDCGTDFHGNEYNSHNSCISEAEKYQGKLYRPKENANKGEVKQQEWMKQIHKASSNVVDPKLKSYLIKISEYSNVPRKKGKFLNFCKNSIRVYNEEILEKLWEAFEQQEKSQKQAKDDKSTTVSATSTPTDSNESSLNHSSLNVNGQQSNKNEINGKRKRKKEKDQSETETNHENGDKDKKSKKRKKDKKKDKITEDGINQQDDVCNEETEENETEKQSNGKFNWQKTIKIVLKDAGSEGIAIKKLRKKVLSAYQEHGTDHKASSKEECLAIFRKKLEKYPKAKIVKEQVFLKS